MLSPSGIYYGQLDLDPALLDETDHLLKHHLLPAAVMHTQQAQPGAPAAMEPPLSLVGPRHALPRQAAGCARAVLVV